MNGSGTLVIQINNSWWKHGGRFEAISVAVFIFSWLAGIEPPTSILWRPTYTHRHTCTRTQART